MEPSPAPPPPRLDAELRARLLNPVGAVVFDKDGTLTDLDRRWVTFFRSIIGGIAAAGDDPEAEHSLALVMGVGVDHIVPGSPASSKTESEMVELVVDHLLGRGWSAEVAITAIGTAVESARFGPLAPLGDVAGSVARLAECYHIGVATSDNRSNTLAELDQLGIAEHVSGLRCGDDGGAVKPDPEVLASLAREWSLDVARILFVGDNLQDGDTARAAGCPFVAVVARPLPADDPEHPSPTAAGADAWITTIEELVT